MSPKLKASKGSCSFLINLISMEKYKCHCITLLQVLEDFDIPEELRDMFISIPAERFRMDISSTEIRKNLGI